jgi:hypothetical protein
MKKQDATMILAEFRDAVRAIEPMKAMQAFNELMNSDGVVTTNFNLAGDFSHALTTLRNVLDAMDRKGIRFPPN